MKHDDAGVSLVEVLVGMGLFGVLSTILLSVSLSTSDVTEHTRLVSEVNTESQLVMERMTRELRQASLVTLLDGSTGPTDPAYLRFQVDFDGEPATVEAANAAPVTLAYAWDPATGDLTISETAGAVTDTGTLAEGVTAFTVTAGSTLWQYDANGDGDTTWEELNDAGPPVGDNDSPRVLDVELPYVDRVEITMTVERDIDGDPFEQTYVTKVDMRNVIPNP